MKRLFLVALIGCILFSLVTNFAYAKVTKEWLQWIKGEFEIPSDIQKVKSVSELQPFLDNDDQFIRMASAKRLGELGDEAGISLLLARFKKEPYETIMPPEGAPIVKLEIIRALAKIGGEKAKIALIGILKEYWGKGPKVGDKEYFYSDGDFTYVVPLILEKLNAWALDNDVFQTAKEIALSEKLNDRIRGKDIRQNTWKLYLKGYVAHQKMSEKDSAKYLLNLANELTKKGVASESLEAAKGKATIEILEGYDEATLSSVKQDLETEREQKKEQVNLNKAATAEGNYDYFEYDGKINTIDYIIEKKAKQKVK